MLVFLLRCSLYPRNFASFHTYRTHIYILYMYLKYNTVAIYYIHIQHGLGTLHTILKTYIAAAYSNRIKEKYIHTTLRAWERTTKHVYDMFRPLSSSSSIYFPYLLLLGALLSHYSRFVDVSFIRWLARLLVFSFFALCPCLPLHIF